MNDELALIEESVHRFALQTVAPALERLSHFPLGEAPPDFVPGLADLGLLALGDSDVEVLSVALSALSRVAAAPAAMVLANAAGLGLTRAARPEAAAVSRDTSAPFAFPLYAEAGLVDDAPALHRDGPEPRLDGVAELVVNAPIAESLVLPVRDGETVSVVLLDPRAAGVSVGPPLLTLGLRGAPTADVTLRSVQVPAERILATDAGALLRKVATRLAGPTAAMAAGILESSLDAALGYARERYQGGQLIIEHQEVKRLLARMLEDHALCREAMAAACRGTESDPRRMALVLRAKERAARATCDGVQLLGGYGYMEDYPVERCMRDAKQVELVFGRTEWARQELVEALSGLR